MLKFSEIREKEAVDTRVPELARIATVLQRRFLLDLFRQTSAKRLSIPQYTLLGFLAAESGVPMGHLAKQMGHATSATTGLVDRLEAAGLVRRASVKGDRRQKLVEITHLIKDMSILYEHRRDFIKKIKDLKENYDHVLERGKKLKGQMARCSSRSAPASSRAWPRRWA